MIRKWRERKRLRIEAEERKAEYRHNREIAIWNGTKFQEWEKEFRSRYEFNMKAALRAALRRGEQPESREVVPWSPYNGQQ